MKKDRSTLPSETGDLDLGYWDDESPGDLYGTQSDQFFIERRCSICGTPTEDQVDWTEKAGTYVVARCPDCDRRQVITAMVGEMLWYPGSLAKEPISDIFFAEIGTYKRFLDDVKFRT